MFGPLATIFSSLATIQKPQQQPDFRSVGGESCFESQDQGFLFEIRISAACYRIEPKLAGCAPESQKIPFYRIDSKLAGCTPGDVDLFSCDLEIDRSKRKLRNEDILGVFRKAAEIRVLDGFRRKFHTSFAYIRPKNPVRISSIRQKESAKSVFEKREVST